MEASQDQDGNRTLRPGTALWDAVMRAAWASMLDSTVPHGEAREIGRLVFGPGGTMRFEAGPGVAR